MFTENQPEEVAKTYPIKMTLTLGIIKDPKAPEGFECAEDYGVRTLFSTQRPIRIRNDIYFEQLGKMYRLAVSQEKIIEYVVKWDFQMYEICSNEIKDITTEVKEFF